MDELKQYTFIKPETLTVDQQYKLYLEYKDIHDVDISREDFYQNYENKDYLGLVLTYYMCKYQTTLIDFTVYNGKIDGIIVDDNIKYKKRKYYILSSESFKTGDNILFIKHISGCGFYVYCMEIEDNPETKST